MNLRGGWELIKRSYLGWLAGRGFYWTLTFGWMVPSLLYLFVWATVAGQGQVKADEVAICVVALTSAIWVTPALAGGGNFGG